MMAHAGIVGAIAVGPAIATGSAFLEVPASVGSAEVALAEAAASPATAGYAISAFNSARNVVNAGVEIVKNLPNLLSKTGAAMSLQLGSDLFAGGAARLGVAGAEEVVAAGNAAKAAEVITAEAEAAAEALRQTMLRMGF